MQNNFEDGIAVSSLVAREGALACWERERFGPRPHDDAQGWLIVAARRSAVLHRRTIAGTAELHMRAGTVSILRLSLGEDIILPPVPLGLVTVFLPDAAVPTILRSGYSHSLHEVFGHRSANLVAVTAYIADGLLKSEPATPLHAGLLKSLISCVTMSGLPTQSSMLGNQQPGRIHITRRKLSDLERFVASHLDQPIDALDLTRVAGMSIGHLCRVMKSDTGLTPYQFVLSMRLKRAHELLATSNMPLVEVALSCGFSNQAHFSATFKKKTGLTPGQFRRISFAGMSAGDTPNESMAVFAAESAPAMGHSPQA
ncbi:helix-turn-helix transcriptional regulator [Erythrobacter colymbi]|uniref:helix-turn-helix transcriptional regulator n=1 Tax=Erythrobacter colymbi TaxID=1161202 RepID=UPI000A38F8C4|nr:AraC family transcriptional regulator [Erythrobacter colymbi]